MANVTPPKKFFKEIECVPLNLEHDGIPIALTNIAAVVASEHLRSLGFRGLHMVALITLAATAYNKHEGRPRRGAEDLLELITPEREAWKEDLAADDQWLVAQGLCIFFGSMPKGEDDRWPTMEQCAASESFLKISRILSCYSLAVDLMIGHDLTVARAIQSAFKSLPFTPEHAAFVNAFAERVGVFASEDSNEMSLSKAWAFARKPFLIPKHELVFGTPATPEEVKTRRMNRGMNGTAQLLKASSEKSNEIKKYLTNTQSDKDKRIFRQVGLEAIIQGDLSQVYCSTFMKREAYERFLEKGVYQDLWTTGPTWHYRYHDQPCVARGFAEMKAFGERGDGITYGYITTCDAWQDEVAEQAVRNYGEVEVYWKPSSVLPFATATLEDSMRAQFMADANHSPSLAYLVVACIGGGEWVRQFPNLSPVIKKIREMKIISGRFIEFQCHAPLTPNDIESVVTYG